jgi:hypothetical protein
MIIAPSLCFQLHSLIQTTIIFAKRYGLRQATLQTYVPAYNLNTAPHSRSSRTGAIRRAACPLGVCVIEMLVIEMSAIEMLRFGALLIS